jgi:cobalt-precorrin-5B (C1)-methyltransferase
MRKLKNKIAADAVDLRIPGKAASSRQGGIVRLMTKKELRYGFTTGACAAAATKGAALMLRDQHIVDEVEITLPAGITTHFRLHGQKLVNGTASCYVIKDGGDDPDVTNGAEVHVSIRVDYFATRCIILQGGTGIGRVTKPGLAVPLGGWAINPVPRVMILEVVKEVFAMRCLPNTLTVTVSIPNGEELAKKTLNDRLGIVGGLSILGTTGIVNPISAAAWTDTIDSAIDVALACGSGKVVLSTGRTSEMAAQKYLASGERGTETANDLKEEAFILMGDHVGHALRACAGKGVKELILAGQFAKLLKIGCGHEQTHASSSELDLRKLQEWLAASPDTSRLTPLVHGANTARQVLDSSENDPILIRLVSEQVRGYAITIAPMIKIKVLLVGYVGEVLYFG